jgi:hypothetical protein
MGSWLVMFVRLLMWGEDVPRGPEMELLSRVQQRIGTNFEQLPNYACLAKTERSIRQGSKKKLLVQRSYSPRSGIRRL